MGVGKWGDKMTHHAMQAGLPRLEASCWKEASKPHCKDKPCPVGSVSRTGVWRRRVYTQEPKVLEHLESSFQTETQRVPWSVGAHDSQSGWGLPFLAIEGREMDMHSFPAHSATLARVLTRVEVA